MKSKNYLKKHLFNLLILALLFPIFGFTQTTRTAETNTQEFIEGTIVIKVKEGIGPFEIQKTNISFGISSLDKKVQAFTVSKLEKRFKHKPIAKNSGLPDLSRIYRIEFPKSQNIHQVVQAFEADPNIEYAEAIPVSHLTSVPNDSLYGNQQHLPQIMASEAWDVHKGEEGEEVIIAIIDTGVDWLHPDLIENCWQNLGEDADGDGVTLEYNNGVWERDTDDLNGVDDDGNGYIDDVIGWDFWEAAEIGDGSNPDPLWDIGNFSHGTHCAGIAAGRTNNNIGISSISYNVKYMPTQATNGFLFVEYGYDAIIYAAENGADIISNSWGALSRSKANQEVIDYATGLGCIVICSAGNYKIESPTFPAGYSNSISVAAVASDDTKAIDSNFGASIDVAAPGVSILSTIPNNGYESRNGTSMATPMVAGLFALLKSYQPTWTNDQLIEQIIGTTDDFDSFNPDFENALGSGRINAYQTLVDENVEVTQALRLEIFDHIMTDEDNDGIFEPGETASISFSIQNFANLVSDDNAEIVISSNDPDITIVNNSEIIEIPEDGIVETGFFEFIVSENAQTHEAIFTITVNSEFEILFGEENEVNLILAASGFFVWENSANTNNYSGKFINEFLEERDFPVMYSNNFPQSLVGFEGVFLSFGNWGSERVAMDYRKSQVTSHYLEAGGKVYVEGGDVFGFDQYSNLAMQDLFGLDSVIDGTEVNSINQLIGNAESITKDMVFNGSSQTANNWIDNFVPSSAATLAFTESDYGVVAVQSNHPDGHQTFCFSYALQYLNDADPHSSRYNFMVQLMDFFGYSEEDGYVIANFKSTRNNVESDEAIQFTDWSLVDEGYEITGWAWDFDEDGEIDSYDQNPSWSYTKGGFYDITLIVSGENDTDTLTKEDFIQVQSGILVYEGLENENGYSGTFIHDYLLNHWYDGVSYTNTFPNKLKGYDAVFLSMGNKGHKNTLVTAEMYSSLFDYCLAGGKIYIEGGDAMTNADSDLGLLFGLDGVSEGEINPVTELLGQAGSIMEGLDFNSSNQLSFESIDRFEITTDFPGAAVAFEESDYGAVAVQFDGSQLLGQKTFCMSYALADLEDGTGVNTRNELLSRILNFFDVVTEVEENDLSKENDLKVYPNPTTNQLTIMGLPIDSEFQLTDLAGNVLMTQKSVNSSTTINLSDFPKGIYFIRTKSGVKKVVKM